MNQKFLEKSLDEYAGNQGKSQPELHQDIMRAVRLAEPAGRKPVFHGSCPAWACRRVAMVLMAVFFYLPQTVPVSPVTGSGRADAATEHRSSDSQLAWKACLYLSEETPAPEQD